MVMDKVRMTHPKLPDVVIDVRETGVAARERAGWSRAKSKYRPAAAVAAVSKKEI